MNIEAKVSGWRITDLPNFPHISTIGGQIVPLRHIDNLNEETAQWILDTFNLVPLNRKLTGSNYGVIMSHDDIIKVSIMENAPEVAEELNTFFSPTDWRKCYLRFGH